MKNELTPEQYIALLRISEESSETTQIVMKILRFGWFSYHPQDSEAVVNRHLLEMEIGDYLACVDRLVEIGALNLDMINEQRKKKSTTW